MDRDEFKSMQAVSKHIAGLESRLAKVTAERNHALKAIGDNAREWGKREIALEMENARLQMAQSAQAEELMRLHERLAKITADWERLEAENVELNMELEQYKRALELANDGGEGCKDVPDCSGDCYQCCLDRAKEQQCQEPK